MVDITPEEQAAQEAQKKLDDEGSDGVQSLPKTEEPPEWFKAYEKKTDGKFAAFGKDLGRERSKRKKLEPGQDGQDQPPAAVSREDMTRAIQLGGLLAALPSETATMIQAQVDDGTLSFVGGLSMARLAKTLVPESADKKAATAEARRQATTKKAPPHPKSVQEFLAIQKKSRVKDAPAADVERYKSLMDDDTFEVNNLPQYFRQ